MGFSLVVAYPYSCQPCGREEWAPERSQTCFPCTVVFLTWHEPMSWVLLAANTLLLLLGAGIAGLFAWHLDTPVVRLAGGRLCFLMLGSLAGGSCGHYGFFGEPTLPTCLLRKGLFALGFAIFLSCLTICSFRLVFIFQFSAKVSAFACSSLLLDFVSWIAFFTMASVYQGKYLPAVNVLAMLSSLSGGFSGYFLPKCYVILCRPDLNSTEHLQASTQDYTRRCGST
ncbi:hypothetical protein J1605_000719 [Eschrichtius robustus]|uniref:G-protein coupled receptors family 3 profile domain-containing protein n=1 Tax=Eschrichtius robustus TaxID=9764 RepID=A0AB34GM84_ESCRO|nr:hypothetical protein J1605_000719 [Eschrichtius robustus]